jgi:predicted XRE-type DNA-binding protein
MPEELGTVRGSGNVFRDFGYPDADVEQAKSVLAAKIISVLHDMELSNHKAEDVTGIKHSDFARIRRVKLDRYSVLRLEMILSRLDY